MNKIERVYDVEFRTNEQDSRSVEGYAVVFNSVTDLGWLRKKSILTLSTAQICPMSTYWATTMKTSYWQDLQTEVWSGL